MPTFPPNQIRITVEGCDLDEVIAGHVDLFRDIAMNLAHRAAIVEEQYNVKYSDRMVTETQQPTMHDLRTNTMTVTCSLDLVR